MVISDETKIDTTTEHMALSLGGVRMSVQHTFDIALIRIRRK